MDKGGLEKVVLDLSILMSEKGFSVSIVTPGYVGQIGLEARRQGIAVLKLNERWSFISYCLLLLRERPAVAISHFSNFGYLPGFVTGVKNITYIHNVYAFLNDKQRSEFHFFSRFVSHFIACSKSAKEYAVTNLKVPKSKISAVSNGLKLRIEESGMKRQTLTRQDIGLTDSNFVVIVSASLNLHKGFFLLLQALEIAYKENSEIRVISLGSPVFLPHFELLKNEVESRGVGEIFRLIGYKENIFDYYYISDALISSSFIEGWSIAVNEGMSVGLPVILSDTGAAAELIIDNDCGFLVQQPFGQVGNLNSDLLDQLSYSPQSYTTAKYFAEAMVFLSRNRETAKEMGRLGREKIETLYSEETWVNGVLEILKKVLGKTVETK